MTEKSANNYPRLPIRENENVLVRIATFPSLEAYDRHHAAIAGSPKWLAHAKRMRTKLKSEPQILRLTPTARSLTHG